MAKKGSVNRTEEVRKYMKAHPNESNTEILRGLESQGTKVSQSLVSQVRKEEGMPTAPGTKKKAASQKEASKKKATAKKKTAATKAAKTPSPGGQVITADEMYDAKQLVDDLGGIDRLRDALNALERLQ